MSHTCSKCGANERCFYNENMIQQLESRQLCFSCNFYWRYLHDPVKVEGWHHHSTGFVVNGKIYTDGGNVENPGQYRFIGHAGHKFRVRMLDGSREWVTNNLWAGGDITPEWRAEIPDTAEFLLVDQCQGASNELA